MDAYFKISELNSSVRQEIIAAVFILYFATK